MLYRKSGLTITRESDEPDIEDFDGATISAVGQTWIFKDVEEDMDDISEGMKGFDTAMIDGTGFKCVQEMRQEDFPLLYAYLNGQANALSDENLAQILEDVYENGKIAMQAFTAKIEDVCREKNIEIKKIEGIWGNRT